MYHVMKDMCCCNADLIQAAARCMLGNDWPLLAAQSPVPVTSLLLERPAVGVHDQSVTCGGYLDNIYLRSLAAFCESPCQQVPGMSLFWSACVVKQLIFSRDVEKLDLIPGQIHMTPTKATSQLAFKVGPNGVAFRRSSLKSM